jgi:hypothetical protein
MWINRGYFGRLTSILQDWLSLKPCNTPITFDLMSNMQQWFNWQHRWTSNMFKDSDPKDTSIISTDKRHMDMGLFMKIEQFHNLAPKATL